MTEMEAITERKRQALDERADALIRQWRNTDGKRAAEDSNAIRWSLVVAMLEECQDYDHAPPPSLMQAVHYLANTKTVTPLDHIPESQIKAVKIVAEWRKDFRAQALAEEMGWCRQWATKLLKNGSLFMEAVHYWRRRYGLPVDRTTARAIKAAYRMDEEAKIADDQDPRSFSYFLNRAIRLRSQVEAELKSRKTTGKRRARLKKLHAYIKRRYGV